MKSHSKCTIYWLLRLFLTGAWEKIALLLFLHHVSSMDRFCLSVQVKIMVWHAQNNAADLLTQLCHMRPMLYHDLFFCLFQNFPIKEKKKVIHIPKSHLFPIAPLCPSKWVYITPMYLYNTFYCFMCFQCYINRITLGVHVCNWILPSIFISVRISKSNSFILTCIIVTNSFLGMESCFKIFKRY